MKTLKQGPEAYLINCIGIIGQPNRRTSLWQFNRKRKARNAQCAVLVSQKNNLSVSWWFVEK